MSAASLKLLSIILT